MKHIISTVLLTIVLGTFSVSAQSTSVSSAEIKANYEAQGINFDQASSMVEMVTNNALEADAKVMADFLRTIATFQAAGVPVPMNEEWLNHWTTEYALTNEQAQDLYKVALRFGLQRR